MEKFVLSKRAKKDLINIWKYTRKIWSEEQAIRYYYKLMVGDVILGDRIVERHCCLCAGPAEADEHKRNIYCLSNQG